MPSMYASGEQPLPGDRIRLADHTGGDRVVDSISEAGLLNVRLPDGQVAYGIPARGYRLLTRDETFTTLIERAHATAAAALRERLAAVPTGAALTERLRRAA